MCFSKLHPKVRKIFMILSMVSVFFVGQASW